MAEYCTVRGLNSREWQKRVSSRLFSAVFFSLFVVVHPLFETSESSWVFGVAAAFYLLQVLGPANRTWQQAGAFFVLVSCLAAALPHLGLRGATYHFMAKVLAGFWGTGVAILVWDWIFARPKPVLAGLIRTSPHAMAIPVLAGVNHVHHPADDARVAALERLRLQAIAEGSPMTENELQFVDYSRIDSQEIAKTVEESLYQDHDYWKFKNSIIERFAHAIQTDRSRDATAKKKYKNLIRDLSRGRRDEQLLTFLRAGFYRARTSEEFGLDAVLLTLIAVGLLTLLIGGAYFLANGGDLLNR